MSQSPSPLAGARPPAQLWIVLTVAAAALLGLMGFGLVARLDLWDAIHFVGLQVAATLTAAGAAVAWWQARRAGRDGAGRWVARLAGPLLVLVLVVCLGSWIYAHALPVRTWVAAIIRAVWALSLY